MIDQIAVILQGLGTSFPQLTALFTILYIVGFAAKVIREAISKVVAETPSKKDDEVLEKVEKSVVGKAVFFILDLFFRIKPVKK